MSFGISIGDIIAVTTLVTQITQRIRGADASFQEFSDDLELARMVLEDLNRNWNTYEQRANEGRLQTERRTLWATVNGIRRGLEDLQRQLNSYGRVGSGLRVGLANLRFTQQLDTLRRRLQFHMSSLQLVTVNLNLMQGQEIKRAFILIRNAQLEQRQEDEIQSQQSQSNGIEMQSQQTQNNENERRWNESLTSYALNYTAESQYGSEWSYASTTSRDALIDRWRREIEIMTAVPETQGPPETAQDPENENSSQRVNEESNSSRHQISRRLRTGLDLFDILAFYSLLGGSVGMAGVTTNYGGTCGNLTLPKFAPLSIVVILLLPAVIFSIWILMYMLPVHLFSAKEGVVVAKSISSCLCLSVGIWAFVSIMNMSKSLLGAPECLYILQNLQVMYQAGGITIGLGIWLALSAIYSIFVEYPETLRKRVRRFLYRIILLQWRAVKHDWLWLLCQLIYPFLMHI
ncbi:uncharacterized protein K441DRAFT_657344 [Cenococcum geophilum 1.58]|uniref:uncharacterized protein n=1 Tax=Cenococcum geophilum 1.58 TaxID=794803 RepID=UPI00358E5D69|nr:hypothetical protein K441DRAFT_657344 [Cenococcum geophilum 1.58]